LNFENGRSTLGASDHAQYSYKSNIFNMSRVGYRLARMALWLSKWDIKTFGIKIQIVGS